MNEMRKLMETIRQFESETDKERFARMDKEYTDLKSRQNKDKVPNDETDHQRKARYAKTKATETENLHRSLAKAFNDLTDVLNYRSKLGNVYGKDGGTIMVNDYKNGVKAKHAKPLEKILSELEIYLSENYGDIFH